MYIEEIKSAIAKYSIRPLFDGKALHSMAKRYPKGKLLFWKEKRFEYIEKIKESSFLGHVWVNSDCIDLTTINNFIDVVNNLIIEHIGFYLDKYLLTEKDKQDWANKEIDTFFSLWLDYRFIDIMIKDLEKKENPLPQQLQMPQRLQTILITNQRAQLFKGLIDGAFIPNDTDPDCFNWAIGVIGEEEPKQPGQWQRIKWKKSKEAFFELFHPVLREISGNEKSISRGHKKLIKGLFSDKDDAPMDSLRNSNPKRESEIEAILRTIGIIIEQPFRHKPIK